MAEQLCRGALADFPGEPNFLSLLGAALNRQGRGAEAERLLRRALEEEPGYAKGQEELGRSLLQLGRFDEAYVDNLFNERAILFNQDSAPPGTITINTPRTWGLGFSMNWGRD